jgi:hypothetical protein
MREIGQGTVPTSEMEQEIFLSLRLAEPSERVRITLDERMLSIEGKRNATVDMRLQAITTMRHHSSNLVPSWLVVLGLALVWIGYRLVVPPTYRLAFIGAGSALIVGRFLTRKPTLSIHTSSGDSHVLFGNERDLNRLGFMFHHLANNNSMAEVRAKLKAIEVEGGTSWREAQVPPAPILPNPLQAPQALERLLAADEGIEPVAQQREIEPEWMPTLEPEPAPPQPVVGYISSFQPVHGAVHTTVYPPDHRPAPVNNPVLVPHPTPPMYQAIQQHGPGSFLPSFFSQDGAHIPGQQPTEESQTTEDDLVLDAEMLDGLLEEGEEEREGVHVEPQPVASPVEQTPTLLRPKTPTTIEESPFRPRRTETLRPKARRGGNVFSRIRDTSSSVLERASTIVRPSPYATSETSGALREQAEAATPPNRAEDVMNSLSSEEGGVMAPEEAARLSERGAQLLAAADELSQSEEGRLASMSFSDLRSSTVEEERVHLPRLDDD